MRHHCGGTCKRPGHLVPPRFQNQPGNPESNDFSLSPERHDAADTSTLLSGSSLAHARELPTLRLPTTDHDFLSTSLFISSFCTDLNFSFDSVNKLSFTYRAASPRTLFTSTILSHVYKCLSHLVHKRPLTIAYKCRQDFELILGDVATFSSKSH